MLYEKARTRKHRNGGGGGRLLVEVVEVFWGLDFVHQTALFTFVKPSQVWSAVLDLTAKHGLCGRVSIDDKKRRSRPARGAEIASKGRCTRPASHHLCRGMQAVGLSTSQRASPAEDTIQALHWAT
jgi:hypothetical protein